MSPTTTKAIVIPNAKIISTGGMIKDSFRGQNQSHMRTLSDNYKYNFSNNDMFYSGPNTLENNNHYFEYKTKSKNTSTFDKRTDFSSPKFSKNVTKGIISNCNKIPLESKIKDSAKSDYSNSKPFEYKFKHSKQDSIGSSKQGNTFDYTKPSKDLISNFTSSNTNENRSKLK